MSVFTRLFRRKEPTSREVAKERLKLVLIHDRVKLSPDVLQRMKDELVSAISKYVEIDRDGIEISLTQNKRLVVDMPLLERSSRRRRG
jgi:cell division topological specificity factor